MITKFKIFETKIDLDSKYIIILVENAIRDRDINLLNKVLESDFDFYNNSHLFDTLLNHARNRYEIYKDVVEKFVDKINIKWHDKYSKSLLDNAIEYKDTNLDIVKLLIKKGVDVNHITTENGYLIYHGNQSKYIGKFQSPTIINYILHNELRDSYQKLDFYLSIIKILIEGGANLMLKDSEGNDFLDYVNMGYLFNYPSQRSNDRAMKKLKEMLKQIDPEIIEQLEMKEDIKKYNL